MLLILQFIQYYLVFWGGGGGGGLFTSLFFSKIPILDWTGLDFTVLLALKECPTKSMPMLIKCSKFWIVTTSCVCLCVCFFLVLAPALALRKNRVEWRRWWGTRRCLWRWHSTHSPWLHRTCLSHRYCTVLYSNRALSCVQHCCTCLSPTY